MRYLGATHIFNGSEFLPESSVLVLDSGNSIKDIIKSDEVEKNEVEFYDGILTPGFINTHCHLELSFLKNVIPEKNGFVEFAKNLISKRNSFTEEVMLSAIEKADEEMALNGIVAVGDISNTKISYKQKLKSKIYYHTFIELLGFNPSMAETIFNSGLNELEILKSYGLHGSLTAHAPYSTSAELIEKITNFNFKNNSSFSIHNQESEEENKFFTGDKSTFYDLYKFLNADISWFKPNYKSSLAFYGNLLKGNNNILVHNTRLTASDYKFLKEGIYICFCPNANLYIENTLPDFSSIIAQNQSICFGTDSLASNHSLNLLNEANYFLKETKNLNLTLKGLTSNAAKALGIENKFGFLAQGKFCHINLIQQKNNQLQLEKIIVHA
ncbi:MAG: amidohydrolase family protein [Bacteroidia bacterium]|nr:amidohydrolase family protein [Bacteroidia bacterium]